MRPFSIRTDHIGLTDPRKKWRYQVVLSIVTIKMKALKLNESFLLELSEVSTVTD